MVWGPRAKRGGRGAWGEAPVKLRATKPFTHPPVGVIMCLCPVRGAGLYRGGRRAQRAYAAERSLVRKGKPARVR